MNTQQEVEFWEAHAAVQQIQAWLENPCDDGMYSTLKLKRAWGMLRDLIAKVEQENRVGA